MTAVIDPELTKAFQDLQVQVLATREKVKNLETEIAVAERRKLISEITKKTVTDLKPEKNCYLAIGRTFVRKPRDEILSQIDSNIEKISEQISTLNQTKEYHNTKVEETQNNIREMIQQRKNSDKK